MNTPELRCENMPGKPLPRRASIIAFRSRFITLCHAWGLHTGRWTPKTAGRLQERLRGYGSRKTFTEVLDQLGGFQISTRSRARPLDTWQRTAAGPTNYQKDTRADKPAARIRLDVWTVM